MPRYFIEVSYKGTNYSGFQIQNNANSIQAEVEKALEIFYKQKFELTGSSRTDTGVHAFQNFFHFDVELILNDDVYNLNAILPDDIVVKRIFNVNENTHCRFDALSREYHYYIYNHKDPFLQDRAFYFPYSLDFELFWGVWDVTSKEKYGANILGVKEVIPRLVNLFSQYNFNVTFATVGFLFCKNRDELLQFLPQTK